MATTKSADVTLDMDLTKLAEEALAEVYEGAPDSFSDPGPENPVIEYVDVDAQPAAGDNRVVLTNVRYPEEEIFMPSTGDGWRGDKVVFDRGRAIATREQADVVLAMCPYIVEERAGMPKFTFDADGFTTTSQRAYEEYVKRYNDRIR